MIVAQNDLIIDETVVFDKNFDFPLDGIDQGSIQLIYTDESYTDVDFLTAAVDADANTVTISAHGLVTGTKITKITTDGTLPGGLSLLTVYYVIVVDADTIKFATSLANAKAGTAVNITNVGSALATHTIDFPVLGTVTAGIWFSNDGSNFQILTTATTITTAGHKIFDLVDKYYKYIRVAVAIDAGAVGMKAYLYGRKY
jgi:hypothetical protein